MFAVGLGIRVVLKARPNCLLTLASFTVSHHMAVS